MLIVLPEKDARDICNTLREKCFLFQPITAPKAIDYLNNMIGDIYDCRNTDPGYPFLIKFPLPSHGFPKPDRPGYPFLIKFPLPSHGFPKPDRPGYPFLEKFPLQSHGFSSNGLNGAFEFHPSISLNFRVEV